MKQAVHQYGISLETDFITEDLRKLVNITDIHEEQSLAIAKIERVISN